MTVHDLCRGLKKLNQMVFEPLLCRCDLLKIHMTLQVKNQIFYLKRSRIDQLELNDKLRLSQPSSRRNARSQSLRDLPGATVIMSPQLET